MVVPCLGNHVYHCGYLSFYSKELVQNPLICYGLINLIVQIIIHHAFSTKLTENNLLQIGIDKSGIHSISISLWKVNMILIAMVQI